ncbi:hypothetical protein Cgig2_014228 [Carnegiea gigantea]|uniref:Uncharacterized protein n=1 Tax=Carnegiea gigantea TaxID=171969 RepID=A0A9Q1JZN3_9CARY|nr:hypothetical protein Cgig2_014228 [Carnegiea gigantea]
MDTDGETHEDIPKLLRKKERPIKVDEHIYFKKLKWQVEMTFGIVQGFKDAISRWCAPTARMLVITRRDVLNQHSLLMASHLHRKGNEVDQGNKLSFSVSQGSKKQELLGVEEELEAREDIASSSGPQSMTDQGWPLISSHPSVAISSSQPFISPP